MLLSCLSNPRFFSFDRLSSRCQLDYYIQSFLLCQHLFSSFFAFYFFNKLYYLIRLVLCIFYNIICYPLNQPKRSSFELLLLFIKSWRPFAIWHYRRSAVMVRHWRYMRAFHLGIFPLRHITLRLISCRLR